MRIIFLGTASCYPTAHRGVSCTAVRFEDGDVWIFDCGEGSQIQIQKSSIHPGHIKKIFITHLHGDHLFGLPGLICTLGSQVQEKGAELLLEIYGPFGLRRYLRETLNLSRSPLTFQYVVYELIPSEEDISEAIKQWKIEEEAVGLLHPQEKLGRHIINDAKTWHLFEDDKIKVEAGFLIHRIPCFGFVIKEKPTPGRLKTEILLNKGLKPGPLYGKFKKGESVKLPSGEIIHPEDVVGDPKSGRTLTILGDTCDSSGMLHIAEFEDDKIKVEAGFLIHRIPCFGFVIKEKPTPGRLKTEILLNKGLKPGPLYGKFKKGESVKLPSGEIIHPEDVVGDPKSGRTLTILGDTCDSSGMLHIAEGSDLLIHEATLEDSLKVMALENMHSTPSMAVDFAKAIKAKKLILFHFSQRYRPLTQEEKVGSCVSTILEDARTAIEKNNLNCNVEIAYDLMEVDVKRPINI